MVSLTPRKTLGRMVMAAHSAPDAKPRIIIAGITREGGRKDAYRATAVAAKAPMAAWPSAPILLMDILKATDTPREQKMRGMACKTLSRMLNEDRKAFLNILEYTVKGLWPSKVTMMAQNTRARNIQTIGLRTLKNQGVFSLLSK